MCYELETFIHRYRRKKRKKKEKRKKEEAKRPSLAWGVSPSPSPLPPPSLTSPFPNMSRNRTPVAHQNPQQRRPIDLWPYTSIIPHHHRLRTRDRFFAGRHFYQGVWNAASFFVLPGWKISSCVVWLAVVEVLE